MDIWAFAADARTERTLQQALAGRKAAKAQRAKLPEALGVLAHAPSPRLLIVDLDDAPAPESAFAQLRAVSSFGTEFVALGSTATAQFARQRRRDGFADYLAKPITVADVHDACATLLDDAPGRDYAGRVVGFAGSGGSGVSTLVGAVARECQARHLNCVILSLDPVLSEPFGMEPAADLSELLLALEDGEILEFDPFEQPANADGRRIALVAYPRVDALPIVPSIDAVQTLIAYLANRASIVLLAGVPDPEALAELLKLCDVRVVLYEPALPSINVAVRCLSLLGAEYPALLMQCHPRVPWSFLSATQIRYALGDREPSITLPHDSAFRTQPPSLAAPPPVSRRYQKALKRAMELIFERIP